MPRTAPCAVVEPVTDVLLAHVDQIDDQVRFATQQDYTERVRSEPEQRGADLHTPVLADEFRSRLARGTDGHSGCAGFATARGRLTVQEGWRCIDGDVAVGLASHGMP